MAVDLIQTLASLQTELFDAIRFNKDNASTIELIKDSGNLDPKDRLRIYQAAYRIRIKESFEEDFTNLLEVMESQEFERLVQKFLDTETSPYYNIAELSGDFAEFIGKECPQWYKLAIVDWLEIRSLHADSEDGNHLTSESNEENISLMLAPTTFIKQINGSNLVVSRKFRQLKVAEMEIKHFSLLKYLEQARTVKDLAEFAEINGFNEEELEVLITQWISDNVILNK